MNILITGIHGFVGSNLVSYLKDKHTIFGLDIVAPTKDGVKKTFAWKDLENDHTSSSAEEGKLPHFDIVIHLAGKAHDTKNEAKADVYFAVNTELTKKIYDYALSHDVKKFIFFSSVKAAADSVENEILTEDVIPSPKGPYGESKIAAENYILSLEEQREKTGMSTYIMRPSMIHGPGNKGNLNLLYNVVSKGIPWPLGAYENKRSFTSIDNLCFVIEKLIAMPVENGIYHISDDEALSTNELIKIICKALGKKANILNLPCSIMNGLAKIGGCLHLPLNPERLQKLTENYVVSNIKIKQAIGIDTMPVRAYDGLFKTIKSFQTSDKN
jgi:nucleoside-diphosphate-sugar epimerase